MQFIINVVIEPNETNRISTKKEYIKIFGIIAEIYQEKLADHFQKLTNFLFKKVKDNDQSLLQVIANSFGLLVEHSLKSLPLEE